MASTGFTKGAAAETAEIAYCNMTFAVPNGDYYRVQETKSGGSTLTLTTWVEVEL